MGEKPEEVTVGRYEDDNREGYELVIDKDDQGDFYISVLPVGHVIGPVVRLTASGGCASANPALRQAIFAAWLSMTEICLPCRYLRSINYCTKHKREVWKNNPACADFDRKED
ncbi:MAG: hypothetical protein ACXADB_05345 [Candidatus Hermodarchaeia archaeon]|jgi:hypothetical protein